MSSSWSRTRRSTPRPAAGDLPTSPTANPATKRYTNSASPATSRRKIATSFSPTTHLRPELKPAPDSWRDQFLDAAMIAALATPKEWQMAQMVADVLVGTLEQI